MGNQENRPELFMTNEKPIHILARLEIGFRTTSARLQESEKDLAATLELIRRS